MTEPRVGVKGHVHESKYDGNECHIVTTEDHCLLAQLTAAEARCHQLQDAYDALTGEKFSDRVHTALKSRAEVAEAAVANLRSVLNARIELWNSSAGSMRDKWRSECADELAALLEKR